MIDRRSFMVMAGGAMAAGGLVQARGAQNEGFNPDKTLSDMGIVLPVYAPTENAFQRFRRDGKTVYISGTTPFVDRKRLHPGTVGGNVTVEQAQEAARRCAVQLLGVMRGALDGDWNNLDQVLRLEGFVCSANDFGGQPQVMNAASELMVQVLGARGRHTRTAIGVNALPFGASVEIAAVISTK